ncbi:MAG: AMP-binding protein [Bacteroidia bacterium]|nr:AMP-binding protein [Bacteroidia bacterium]
MLGKIIAFYRFLLSLRYKTELKGTETFTSGKPKVFFPNHQAMADSQLIFCHIYKFAPVVPLIGERFYNKFFLTPIFKKIKAIPVSDLEKGSKDLEILDKITSRVSEALKNGDNVLLYPSGHLTGQGYEKIMSKKSAWQISKMLPENAQIIGVRVSGLWGSMWSKAWTGKSPVFISTYLKGILIVLANLIFLVPRRKITLEFSDITAEARTASKNDVQHFNNFLERYYNIHGEEEVRFFRHFFFLPSLKRELAAQIEGSVQEQMSAMQFNEKEIHCYIFEKIRSIVCREARIEENIVQLNSSLNIELGIDSITLVTIISAIESQYKIVSDAEIADLKTIADLCLLVIEKTAEKEETKPSYLDSFIEPVTDAAANPDITIPEAFIRNFSRYKAETFAYDKIMGSTTRKDFLLKAYVVAKIIKKEIEGQYVGIMLPAMQSTTLLIMAAYLSGKIPVMLNWTVGKMVMDHCMELVKIKHILTAERFYKRVEPLLSDAAKDKCIFFEKKVKEAGFGIKLNGLFRYLLKIRPSSKLHDTAIVLFTSGSESLPKAVPLSHRNIMFNIFGALKHIQIKTDKILLGILPPFHSFGFTILSILPVVAKVKVAYYPDPTDSKGIIKIIRHTKANTILATPTFLKLIMAAAGKEGLKHVKLAITGAESLHQSVIQEFYAKTEKDSLLIEGYGITECSPVLTINPVFKQKEKSVGTFLAGIDYLIADYNNFKPAGKNKEGMIMVKGDNVFDGYMDKNIESPFVTINGKKYYKTGDLGYLDDEDFLFITGRLKRLVKVAGEMIGLQAIENTLLDKYGSLDKVTIAVEGFEGEGKAQVILFSVMDIDLQEVNTYLRERGFSNLVKISRIYRLNEIPLLGTGKTDYKQLKSLLKD